MKSKWLCFIFIFTFTFATAQTNLDSLYGVWKDKTQADSIRAYALDDYSWFGYSNSKYDSLIILSDTLYAFSLKRNLKKTMSTALYMKGYAYNRKRDYANALDNYQKSLRIREEIADSSAIAFLLLRIGKMEMKLGKSGDLGHLYRSLDIYEEIGDSIGVINAQLAVETLYLEGVFDEREEETLFNQQKKDIIAAQELKRKKLERNGFIIGFTVVLLFAGVFFRQRNRIGKEKERSEALLQNILPKEVADELKAKGSADAKDFEIASILFTDFKGFTQASEKLTAKALIEEINVYFKAFDYICETYGIEKIKTIGDAYMAAGGLPIASDDSVKNTVLAALDMQAFVSNRIEEKRAMNEVPFEMRLGIHSGPVVAGIVGVKKFQYDIWGDAVNTASRIESSGVAGKVNISEATYKLLKDDSQFQFESRGKIQAKGKGEIEMYFVNLKKE